MFLHKQICLGAGQDHFLQQAGGGREGGGGRGHRNCGRGGYQHALDRHAHGLMVGRDCGVVTCVSNSESTDDGRGGGATVASAGAAAAMVASATSMAEHRKWCVSGGAQGRQSEHAVPLRLRPCVHRQGFATVSWGVPTRGLCPGAARIPPPGRTRTEPPSC